MYVDAMVQLTSRRAVILEPVEKHRTAVSKSEDHLRWLHSPQLART